jgi:CheY-like chemotaxis protein
MCANRQIVSVVLQAAGLVVDQAENGLDALSCVAEHDYDLMLMDMQMPVMDGLTATRRLREQGFLAPIVAVTANVTTFIQHHPAFSPHCRWKSMGFKRSCANSWIACQRW